MPNDGESSIKLQATADIAQIVAWTRSLREATAAMRDYAAAAGDANVGGPGGAGAAAPSHAQGGGAATGAPPPAPSSAGGAGGTMGPPPAPTAGGAATGAPPPPPPSSIVAGASAGGAGASAGGAGAGAGGAGAGATPPSPSGFSAGSYARSALGFGANVASTALGVGLGTSLFGLPFQAIQTYLHLSTTLTQLSRTFREATDNSEMFGQALGYGIERSAGLARAYGAVRNAIPAGAAEASRMTGFARFTGMDAGATLSGLGRIGSLQGAEVGDKSLWSILGAAKERGMDQGRLPEFLSMLQGSAQEQFNRTGSTSVEGALGMQALNQVAFGPDDPRRANNTTLAASTDRFLTGSSGMQATLLRAMGFGKEGGPSYMDAMVRVEAGMADPRNLIDVFKTFRGNGLTDPEHQFQALLSNGMPAVDAKALVEGMGSEEGLKKYEDLIGQGMKDEGGESFTDLGKQHVSLGEGVHNTIESFMARIGADLAPMIPPLQDALLTFSKTIMSLMGDKSIGETATAFMKSLADFSHWVDENVTGKHTPKPFVVAPQGTFDADLQRIGLTVAGGMNEMRGLEPNDRTIRQAVAAYSYAWDESIGVMNPAGGKSIAIMHPEGGGGAR